MLENVVLRAYLVSSLFHAIIFRSKDLFLVGLMQYEPELFPGLIYRMKQPKIVLLIFVSGKIVLTGAKVIWDFLLFIFAYFVLANGGIKC